MNGERAREIELLRAELKEPVLNAAAQIASRHELERLDEFAPKPLRPAKPATDWLRAAVWISVLSGSLAFWLMAVVWMAKGGWWA